MGLIPRHKHALSTLPHPSILSPLYASVFSAHPLYPSQPNVCPKPVSPQNALWVIIIRPVVTHTYTHLRLFKWPHRGGCVCYSISLNHYSLLQYYIVTISLLQSTLCTFV